MAIDNQRTNGHSRLNGAGRSHSHSFEDLGFASEREAPRVTAFGPIPYSGFGAELRGAPEQPLPARVPVSAFGEVLPVTAFVSAEPQVRAFQDPHWGERLVHIPALRAHASREPAYDLSRNNCVLRWANAPAGYTGPLDVVVHFHGFHNPRPPGANMRLTDKANLSGLDLRSPGVSRPTLGIIPHGRAFPSRSMPGVHGFDFRAIDTREELDRFIDTCLATFRTERRTGEVTRGRVTLTGHSGGGAALSALMRSIGASAQVHGFHYFDATYGGADVITAADGWLAAAIERDARAVAGLGADAQRTEYMAARGSGLRIVCIDPSRTAAVARDADAFVQQRLQAAVSDDALRSFLRRYYRAESVIDPRSVGHGAIPGRFGGRFLANPAVDAPTDARALTPRAPRAPARRAVSQSVGLDWSDPLELSSEGREPHVFGLGYGADWDGRIRTALNDFHREFSAIPVRCGGTTVNVHPPYLINVPNLTQCPNPPPNVSVARLCRARGNRASAPAALRTLLNDARFRWAHLGKPTPAEIRDFLQAAADQNLVVTSGTPTAEQCRQFLIRYGIGIDCSGFVAQAINRVVGLFQNATASDRIANVRSYPSGAFRGSNAAFEAVANPRDLCGGDAMWLRGHIRIITMVERRGDRIVFETIESKPGPGSIQSPGYVGPARAYYRLVPRPGGNLATMAGYRLQRADSMAATDEQWRADDTPHVYSHYRPLRRLLAAAGATPTGLSLDDTLAGALDTPIERVRSAIAATLAAFERVRVTVQAPAAQALDVRVPYFINVRTSPSYRRAAQRRPSLLQNATLSQLYRSLPTASVVGKTEAAQVRSLLQRALDAGVVPGQSQGASADALTNFLSDLGVGLDCSGFVSQALNACMSVLGRTERINTNSANLRGGSPGNARQFDLLARPRDLQPGDTMWKSGHIRIVRLVEPQRDGSIHVTTAESSSVNLVGPRTRVWRCPDADRFSGVQKQSGGRFIANDETNVWSRYKPLGAALAGSSTAVRAGAPARAPASAPPPSGERPAGGERAPREVPTTTIVTRALAQPQVDRLAAVTMANSRDIDAFFSRRGGGGFIDWFNSTLAGRGPFRGKRINATPALRGDFAEFWNAIPVVFSRDRITPIDFAGLMCINLNEAGGNFGGVTENVRGGLTDIHGVRHQGLAYPFDRFQHVRHGVTKSKNSYNVLRGNKTAGELFNDADFRRAHGHRDTTTRLAGRGDDFGGAWRGTRYPSDQGFSTDVDLSTNGFIMQADFFKFRGRGVIQSTGRGVYKRLIEFIKTYTGSNAVLNDFKRRWANLTPDVAATVSSDEEWDTLFDQGEIRARGVALHAAGSDLNQLSTEVAVLNYVPTGTENVRGEPRSIYHLGRRISGRRAYGDGIFRERVNAMLNAMLALV